MVLMFTTPQQWMETTRSCLATSRTTLNSWTTWTAAAPIRFVPTPPPKKTNKKKPLQLSSTGSFYQQYICARLKFVSVSQVNEFSVEPPGHSDDEYEVMVQAEVLHHPADPQKNMQPGAESLEQSQSQLKPHRPLSLDVNSRHTKSLSLPYMTSPVRGPEESSTEEEEEGEEDSDDYSSEDEESMFMKSLPPDFFFNSLGRFGHEDVDRMDGVTVEELRLREQTESESLHSNEQTGGDQGQREVMEEEEDDEGRVETETTENKEEGKDHNEPKEELEEEELEEEQEEEGLEEEGQEEEGQEEEGLEEQAIR